MNLAQALEPIAGWFNKLGTPEPIVHWGHPVMMGIVIFVLGGFVGYVGWRGRLATDEGIVAENFSSHRKLAPLMYLFIVLGATGGVLSLVMQGQPILESRHFVTGVVVLILLGINAVLAITKFGGNKSVLRTVHAYIGSMALAILVAHTVFGLNLGMSF